MNFQLQLKNYKLTAQENEHGNVVGYRDGNGGAK